MINVLVTGSEGQLGKSLKKKAYKYPQMTFIFKDKLGLDITDKNNIQAVFKKHKFHYCINCAAFTDVEQAEKQPKKAFAVNGEGVKNIALACKANNVVLIHISTDYVFDGEKKAPYTTQDKPNPINEYGKSKLLGEQYIQQILKKYYIVRASWLYSEFGKNFYKTILKKAQTEPVIYVTDREIGCPTNTDNLAIYIFNVMVLGNKDYGIYHFTDGEAMTWFDFAIVILSENNLEGKVQIVRGKRYHTFARRPKNSILEVNKSNLYK